ncbi:hypothetical protein M409DRAFT_26935 [Zasmidium cellare ATCC 36951]|uniref:Uncharacterized protein n=1 Tax=Zasmidium cellare ATCC 36951 TaxID=1080233 RepID=A0A6A6CAN0_ZASCE|nr:uncharacterized protein M409DRAFT_26935 [Zasmidium cellare ATCC 36951]KAF2162699.1 hypothetical protein M409DRAFT_26935 [Zasmidium cellare ATCC 36951]
MAKAKVAKKKTTIFSLSTEVRNTIWHYTLEDDNEQCTRKRRTRECRWCINRCPSYQEPPVLQVSRQVRCETQSVWYANATFYFHDGSDKLLEFLVFLGNHKTAKIANLKDEPSFGKPSFARKSLEEVYHKIHALGIQLSEQAIEVSCHEGVRLLKSTLRKDIKVTMRKKIGGGVATTTVSMPRMQVSSGSASTEDEGSSSDSLLPNDDTDSDATLDYSDGSEYLA